MNEILLILHFLGLGAGTASAVGNGVVGALIGRTPENAPVLGKVGDIVSRFGDAGLVLLWVTGIIMVWSVYGGPGAMPVSFWIKLALVVVLTGLIGLMHARKAAAKRGDAAAMAMLPMLGRIAAVVLIAIVTFAVIAFH